MIGTLFKWTLTSWSHRLQKVRFQHPAPIIKYTNGWIIIVCVCQKFNIGSPGSYRIIYNIRDGGLQ